jgi:hypothetical protein
MKKLVLAAAAAVFGCAAQAQTYHDSGSTVVPAVVPLAGCSSSGNCAGPVSTTNPLPVSGSFSASLSGFQPTPAYATLAVSTTSSRVALPAGTVVVVYNTGSNPAYVSLGGSSATATASGDVIQPSSWMAFTVGSNTYLAAIETAGSTALNISGGSGLPTGAGGGGGGGGGGSNASVGSTGSAIPSSGTYAAMNVGGSLTGLTGTANGLKVDGSAVTQPVSAASLPLPSGAATAANQTAVQATAGSAVPGSASYLGANSAGLLTGLVQASASAPISVSTAGTTQLVAGSSGKKTYVTAWDVIAAGSGNITLEYGTQTSTPCDTGTTALTGPYSLAGQAGISKGNGLAPVFVVPAGNALCALTSAAVQMSGSISYTQF